MVDTLIIYALDKKLFDDIPRRKKIYKLSETYENRFGITILAREYFVRVRRRKELVDTFKKSEKTRKDTISAELSPEVRSNLMKSAGDFVQKGIELFFAEPNPENARDKLDFDPTTRNAITLARKHTFYWIIRPNTASFDAITRDTIDEKVT